MKVNKTNEELFDAIFREDLGNASSQVPPGAWEGISSGLGSSAIAGTASNALLWMKAAIAIMSVTAVSVVTYQVVKNTNNDSVSQKIEKTVPQIPNDGIASIEKTVQVEPETSLKESKAKVSEAKDHKGESNTKKVESKTKRIGANAKVPNGHVFSSPMWPEIKYMQLPTIENLKEDTVDVVSLEEASRISPNENEKVEKSGYTYVNDSSEIFIPNTVTPNGDGINDTYLIHLVGEEKVEITIYDMNMSEVLFNTKNKYESWNCKLPGGEAAPSGTYIVKVVYKFKGHPEKKEYIRMTLIK